MTTNVYWKCDLSEKCCGAPDCFENEIQSHVLRLLDQILARVQGPEPYSGFVHASLIIGMNIDNKLGRDAKASYSVLSEVAANYCSISDYSFQDNDQNYAYCVDFAFLPLFR